MKLTYELVEAVETYRFQRRNYVTQQVHPDGLKPFSTVALMGAAVRLDRSPLWAQVIDESEATADDYFTGTWADHEG